MKPTKKAAKLQRRIKSWDDTLKSRGTMSKMRVDATAFHRPGSLKK